MLSLRFRLAALLLFCCAGAAQAQFVWIAPNGTRQYSDQPPPPGTPPAKILKAPGRPAPAQEAAPAPAPRDAATAKAKAPTLAEREADYRKRGKEREDSERQAQAEALRAAARVEHCQAVRKNRQLAESGIRIADIGPDGKKRYLSDAERAALSESTARQMNECR